MILGQWEVERETGRERLGERDWERETGRERLGERERERETGRERLEEREREARGCEIVRVCVCAARVWIQGRERG